MATNMLKISIPSTTKIHPYWDFWFESIGTIWQPCCAVFKNVSEKKDGHLSRKRVFAKVIKTAFCGLINSFAGNPLKVYKL
jgi:hypothetical protein